jgi:hypothetical protein
MFRWTSRWTPDVVECFGGDDAWAKALTWYYNNAAFLGYR